MTPRSFPGVSKNFTISGHDTTDLIIMIGLDQARCNLSNNQCKNCSFEIKSPLLPKNEKPKIVSLKLRSVSKLWSLRL